MSLFVQGAKLPTVEGDKSIKAEIRCIGGKWEFGIMTGGYYCCQQWSFYPLSELPPHGRLKKRVVYRGEVYNALESARINALDGILSDPYKDGFHDGIKRAIQILANEVDDAPAVIPAEEGET